MCLIGGYGKARQVFGSGVSGFGWRLRMGGSDVSDFGNGSDFRVGGFRGIIQEVI